jgi:hypothetical protein
MRRALSVIALAAAAVLAVPAGASAHGLVQRANLPIPEDLFIISAAVVLAVSFVALAVLWPEPRMQGNYSWQPLPGLGSVLGSRAVEVLCGAVGVALLVVVLVAGYAGSGTALDNFAPTFILITFWVGMVFVSLVFGDVFRAFNPWRALGRLVDGFLRHRPYPERLGRWPAAVGLLVFTWIELCSGWGEEPRTLATAALGYTILMLIGQAVYGVETWTRRGDAFAVYYGLFAAVSPFETRDRVVGLRPPLTGLPKLDMPPGTVAFIAVMIGTVTFDGLSQGAMWRDISTSLVDGLTSLGVSAAEAPRVASTIGLLAGVALVGGFYWLGVEGARTVGGGMTVERLGRGFAHTLVPIAAVYVAAHYLTFLLFEGQAITYLASDPFGQGWDLFGTASAAIDYSLLSQNGAWYLQVAFVVLGHVCALTLAHDRALAMYRDPRLAVRSQYWMLGVMVGFTTLALWLLKQAGT